MSADVLNSWKEIAAYMHCSVRSVQRWEREMDFPVRRPRGKGRSAVIALKSEIELWFRMPHGQRNANFCPERRVEIHRRLLKNTKVLQTMTARLINGCDALRREIDLALKLTSALRNGGKAGSPQALTAEPSRNDEMANLWALDHRS